MTNTTLLNALLTNRGFSGAKIDVDNYANVKEWHALLDNLLNASYDVYSQTHNEAILDKGTQINYSDLYGAWGAIRTYIGTVNGLLLNASYENAQVFSAHSITFRNKKSAALQFVYSQKSNATRYLNELKNINGANEDTIAHIEAEIEVYDAKIEELKGVSNNLFKDTTKVNKGQWYKFVEDYVADLCNKRLVMTEAEVQAEQEAIRQARRAKTAAKKTQKKAQAVKVEVSAQ